MTTGQFIKLQYAKSVITGCVDGFRRIAFSDGIRMADDEGDVCRPVAFVQRV